MFVWVWLWCWVVVIYVLFDCMRCMGEEVRLGSWFYGIVWRVLVGVSIMCLFMSCECNVVSSKVLSWCVLLWVLLCVVISVWCDL